MSSSYIDQAIMTYALADSNLTSIIGQRLYFIKAKQGAEKPYGVFKIAVPDNTPEKFGYGSYGQPLVQFTFVSEEGEAIPKSFLAAHAVMDRFRHFQGSMDGVQVDGIDGLRGPREMELPDTQDIACIVEFIPHYVEP